MVRNAAISLIFPFFAIATAFAAGHDLTSPLIGAAAYPIVGPVAATNGTSFLTLWRMDTHGGGTDMYATAADDRGQPLATTSVPVEGLPSSTDLNITVAGSRYFAVSGFEVFQIFPDGRTATKSFTLPAPGRLCWNGKNFLLVSIAYLPIDNASNIALFLLDANGRVIRKIDTGAGFTVWGIQITTAGDDFVILESSNAGAYLMRVSSSGEVEAPVQLLLDRQASIAAVAASADDVIVVGATRVGNRHDLWSAAVSADGIITQTTKLPTGSWPNLTGLSIAPYADGFVVAAPVADLFGSKSQATIALRIDKNGSPVDANPVVIPAGGVSTVTNGRVIYTVGLQRFATGSLVAATTLEIDGTGFHPVRTDVLSTLPHRQSGPVAASDGIDFLAAWSDQTADTQSITAARMSRTGFSLDGAGIDVMRVNGYIGSYAAAHGGAAYILVWHLYQQLWAQRFSSGGVPIDPAPILVQTDIKSSLQVAAAAVGSDFFVVWATGKIYGAFVRADGSVSAARQISPLTPPPPYTAEIHTDPDVAWDGRRFVVVWTTVQTPLIGFPPVTNRQEIRALRVDPDGAPIDSEATVVAGDRARARIASSGRNFLVTLDGFQDVLIAVGRADGSALSFAPPIALFRYPIVVNSDVVWDGASYVVGWRSFLTAEKYSLVSAQVTESGVALSMSGTETGPADLSSSPALAANSFGQTLAVISEVRDPGSERARGYFTSELPSLPPAPAAPTHVLAVPQRNTTYVRWDALATGVEGFVIEGIYKGYSAYVSIGWATAEARNATILNTPTLETVRVRAYGLGGASDPSDAAPVQPPRRRTIGSR